MLEINIEKALKNGTLQEKIDNMKREIERMDNEIKRCEKALEESKKPKLAIPFFPEIGKKYWSFTRNGNSFIDTVTGVDDIKVCNTLGGYKSSEEAKLAYEKRRAEIELLIMCDGLYEKECFTLCFECGVWRVDFWNCYKSCPYRFKTEESCQAAVKKLGDRNLRLIFNIPLED